MDRFVHLCMFDNHPMEYVAKQQGRIGETTFLKIDPRIVNIEGAMFTDRVANDGDAVPRPLAEIDDALDLEVVYTYADWKDPEIRERLNRAKKYEILIPTYISVDFLGK